MKKHRTLGLNAFERHFYLYYLIYVFAVLLLCAFALIGQAVKSNGDQRDICLSLGTGLITSFLVSLAFVFAGKTMRRIETIKQRESFFFDFKTLLHAMITYVDFDATLDSPKNIIDYIKIQHRWFHDYYKKMVAKKSSLKETNTRKKQVLDFYKMQSGWIKQYFEFDNRWKNCYLNKAEKLLLDNFYISFKKAEMSLQLKSYKQAFYDFAFFLEWMSRLPSTFRELKNFKLITISSKDNKAYFDFSEFYKKEKYLEGANSFHEIRNKEYISEYSSKQDKKVS